MKLPSARTCFLTLFLGVPLAAIVCLLYVARSKERFYHGTYLVHQKAISYVARLNDERTRFLPRETLEHLLAFPIWQPPAGFTVRVLSESERGTAPWLKEADFVLEQTGPPYLVVASTGTLWHVPPDQPPTPWPLPTGIAGGLEK